MTEVEFTKVEVSLPKELHEALSIFCNKFEYDGNEVVEQALIGFFEACFGNNFGPYLDRVAGRIEHLLENE